MKNLHFLLLSILFPMLSFGQSQSISLDSIISTYQNHEDYNPAEYPLGRHDEALAGERADFAKDLLTKLEQLPVKGLTTTETTSYKLLRFVLQDDIDAYSYKMYLNPVQGDQGFHLDLNYRIRPINSVEGAENYLAVLKAIPYFTRSNFTLLRKGLAEGISHPKVIFKGYETGYNTHIVENPTESPFYAPFLDLPERIPQ